MFLFLLVLLLFFLVFCYYYNYCFRFYVCCYCYCNYFSFMVVVDDAFHVVILNIFCSHLQERWSSKEALALHYGHVTIKVTEIKPFHGMGRPNEIRIPISLYVVCIYVFCCFVEVNCGRYLFNLHLPFADLCRRIRKHRRPMTLSTDSSMTWIPTSRSMSA
jgi:hypothetical protein